MMAFSIQYELEGDGWANASIIDGEKQAWASASYIHDSLDDLAQMALDLKKNRTLSVVSFQAEPGGTAFIVKNAGIFSYYEVRGYEYYEAHRGIDAQSYEVELVGKVKTADLIASIIHLLQEIYENTGVRKYKKLWLGYEFPEQKYLELSSA